MRGVFVQAELTVARGGANYDSNGGKVFRKWKCLIGFGGEKEGVSGGGGNLCRVTSSKEMDRVFKHT